MSDDYMEIQRRNFEAQFGSLLELGYDDKSEAGADFVGFSDGGTSSSEASDQEGLELEGSQSGSDSESQPPQGRQLGDMDQIFSGISRARSKAQAGGQAARVVKLSESFVPTPTGRAERKMARSGRAPTLKELEEKQREAAKVTRKQQQQAEAEDAANLENDLKLQRLLKESHILAHNMEHSGADLTLQTIDVDAPVGNARRRILEQRIRQVSAVHSSTNGLPRTLQKMPMKLRKSLIQARAEKVKAYEQEARDAGIVLSKLKKGQLRDIDQGTGATPALDRLGFGTKQKAKPRDRGLKIQSVGKSTRNGLRISQHEFNRISKGRR